jgi:hypothetical protein
MKTPLRLQHFPKSLFVTVFIVLCTEGFVYIHEQNSSTYVDLLLTNRFYPANRAPSLEESIIQWQVYHALASSKPVDILLLGDSSCMMGLRPKILEERTGLNCWDIGTLDYFGVQGNVDLLEVFLQQRKAPKVIVFHIVGGIASFSKSSLDQMGYVNRLRTWLAPYLEEKKHWKAVLMLPSMRYRREAQRLLATFSQKENEAWLNTPRGPYPSDNEVRRLLLNNHGAMTEVVYEDEVNRVRDLRPMLGLDPYAIQGIQRLIELSARASSQLLIIHNPIPDTGETPENLEALAAFETQLRNITQGYNHVKVYSPFARFYPVQLCASYNHLTDEGAIRNSEEVSRWLIDVLALKTNPLNES